MWRQTRQAIINCFIFFARCGRSNSNIDDDFAEILENFDNDMNDPPGVNNTQVRPHLLFHATGPPEPDGPLRERFQHRPDAPWSRRRSPPEIVEKMRLALEEMRIILDNGKSHTSAQITGAARKLLCLHAPLSGFNYGDSKNIVEDEDEDDDEDDNNDWYTS